MKNNILKIILILLVVALGFIFVSDKKEIEEVEEAPEEQVKKVSIERVGDIERVNEDFVSYGKVVSSSKVEVSPETSGLISSVNYRLGSFVNQGQIIVELNNTTERQSVLQATAGLSQAQANLNKTNSAQPETLSNLKAEVDRTKNNLDDQERQMEVILSGLNTGLLSVLENTINVLFSNEESVNREFIPPSKSLLAEQELEDKYDSIFNSIKGYASSEDKLVYSESVIPEVAGYLQEMINLVDTVTESQSVTAATISGWKNSLDSAKSNLESRQAQIISQNTNIFNAEKAFEVAQNNFEEQSGSGQSIDTTIAQSSVDSARASLALAQINLEKTLVRAPISGILSEIDIRVGQLAGPSGSIFTIESDNVLRIDTSLSSDDIKKVKIGDIVSIDDKYSGSVSNISPSIGDDGKIEVRILLNSDATLVSGLGVSIKFTDSSSSELGSGTEFVIPIEAVFVRNNKAYVYAVSEGGLAEAIEIETDSLFGDKIVVRSGLVSDDRIVTYARGIKDGEKVTELK